jgi:hypothetical protein
VADSSLRIVSVNPSNGEQAVVSAGGLLANPIGLALEATGTLIVADPASGPGGALLRVDPENGEQTVIYDGPFDGVPVTVAIDAQGALIVFERSPIPYEYGTISRIDAATRTRVVVSTGGFMVHPWGIALDGNGDILVADYATHGFGDGALILIDAANGAQTLLADGGGWHGVAAVVTSTPRTTEDCKKGGWRSFRRADGTSFKNQGSCVSYVNTGR